MRFDARLGIAGAVAMTGQTINVDNAYEHPLFYKEVDAKPGIGLKLCSPCLYIIWTGPLSASVRR